MTNKEKKLWCGAIFRAIKEQQRFIDKHETYHETREVWVAENRKEVLEYCNKENVYKVTETQYTQLYDA